MFVLFAVCLKHFGALKKKIHNFGHKRSFGKQQVSCSRVCSVNESKQKEIRVGVQLLCCTGKRLLLTLSTGYFIQKPVHVFDANMNFSIC